MNQQFLVQLILRKFKDNLNVFENKAMVASIYLPKLSKDELINFIEIFTNKELKELICDKNDKITDFEKYEIKRIEFLKVLIFINHCDLEFEVTFENLYKREFIFSNNGFKLQEILKIQNLTIMDKFKNSLIFFNKIFPTYSILKYLDYEFIITYDLFQLLNDLGQCFSLVHHCINKNDQFKEKLDFIQKSMEEIQKKYDHYMSPEGLKGSTVIKGLIDGQKIDKKDCESEKEDKEGTESDDCSSGFLKDAEVFLKKRGYDY